MVNFPVFESIDITNYGLYPGAEGNKSGLHVDFLPGLTLVLGANGLGKTTLVNILFRLLTGPFDIPKLEDRPELGNLRLDAAPLSPVLRSFFAQRVMDNARNAKARLTCRFGENEVIIERQLNNLNLTQFSVNNKALSIDEITSFQVELSQLVNVSSFGDWILILRHLVFYFEDRRELVWDATAQRQILRILFLSPTAAGKWVEDERAILSKDSQMRNERVVLNRQERDLKAKEAESSTGADVRSELTALRSGPETSRYERAV